VHVVPLFLVESVNTMSRHGMVSIS
jgi:hypothetical protein